jgi:hypothetical protein
MRTIFPCKTGHSQIVCTEFAQLNARTPDRRVRFPVTIRHRTSKAKIYRPAGKFNYYRVAFAVAGKRRMQTFANYPAAKAAAERIVRDAANGSQAAALNVTQSRDALAAFERLQGFYQTAGRRVSLLAGISEFVEASGKLGGRTMGEAVEGYLRTVASVKRKDIGEAVTEFLQVEAPRTKAADGQRAQLSGKYAYNRKLQLNRFADAFPSTAVSELSREHLDKFIGSLNEFSAKSRNHYRAAVRQFLQWAIRASKRGNGNPPERGGLRASVRRAEASGIGYSVFFRRKFRSKSQYSGKFRRKSQSDASPVGVRVHDCSG